MGEVRVDSVVQNYQLNLVFRILFASHKEITRVRVCMDKAFFENHVDKHLRNQLRQVFQINAYFVEFGNSGDWNACLVTHGEHAWPSIFVVNLGDCHPFVSLENSCTALRILGLNLKVKFSGQPRLEFVSKPPIAKVGEDSLGQVAAELNHLQVAGDLLLNPLVLNLDCYHLARCS